jgi:hypothetical protein
LIFSAHVGLIQSAGIPVDRQNELFSVFLETLKSLNMQVTEQLQNAHGVIIRRDQIRIPSKGETKHKPRKMQNFGARNAEHGVVLDKDRISSTSVI